MIKRVYGVNIAVHNLEEAVSDYQRILGVEPIWLGEGDFAFPGLKGAAFCLGETAINLISSSSEDTSIAKFLSSKGEGVFLVSLETDNAAQEVGNMKERGARFILGENTAGAFGEVNFIHPKSMHGVQVEIYELSPPKKEARAKRK